MSSTYKINNFIKLGILIGLLFTITGYAYAGTSKNETTFDDVKNETNELLMSLRDYGVDKRNEALHESKEALNNLDQRIDSLESKMQNQWQDINSATKDKYRQSLKALRKQRTDVAEWYGSLKHSTDESWDDVKTGFTEAYQVMSDTWEKVEKEYSDDAENQQ